MALQATARVVFNVTESNPVTPGVATFQASIDRIMEFATGVGAAQADLIYLGERTVASGVSDDIDLNGVLTRPLGGLLTAAEIVGLIIINANAAGVANSTTLTVGGGSNPVTGYLGGTTPTLGPIRPGGVRMLFETDAAGLCTVVAGTGDILRVTNSAGAVATYQIAVLARSS